MHLISLFSCAFILKLSTCQEATTNQTKDASTKFDVSSTEYDGKSTDADTTLNVPSSEYLVAGVTSRGGERQSFDGWFNNRGRSSFGSVDSTLIRLLPSAYQDGVSTPVKKKKEANPLKISEAIMKEEIACANCNTLCSKTGKNVLMVFFGLFVVEEILNSRKPSCPPEYFNIEIPSNHSFSKAKVKEVPFVRTNYDKNSGTSPNNPRKQINSATPWIDGSAIYGTSKSVSDVLRSFQDGQLDSLDSEKKFPALNEGYLSLLLPVENVGKMKKGVDGFKLGNTLSHENPHILTFNVLFFRWHNKLAEILCKKLLKDEDCFFEARKWVIATLQHIIVDEWLPELLGEKLPEYQGYNPGIDPGISHVFQSAAMRFGHTLVPSAVYWRDLNKNCHYNITRLCNSFYDAKEVLMKHDIDALLLGMAFQSAENEDIQIVNDLRKYLYGPVDFTRRDLMAINIQRGRDHGLPGYGVVRNWLQPSEEKFTSFEQMATKCRGEFKNVIEYSLKEFYDTVDDVDLWVGGLLESDFGPGPLFKTIIKEQFQRIRHGDRFWFENTENGLFSAEEITRIRRISLYDIVLDVTSSITAQDLHQDIFHVPFDDVASAQRFLKCSIELRPYSCVRLQEHKNCYALPPLKETSDGCLSSRKIEHCKETEPKTYDYFTGSGIPYILTFLFLFFFIIGCIATLILMIKWRQKGMIKVQESIKIHRRKTLDENSVYATEWIDRNEGTREIIVRFNGPNKHLNTHLLNNQALRSIDLNNVQMIELQVSVGGHENYTLIRVAREYDLLVKFNNEEERGHFIGKLESFLGGIGIGRQRREINAQNMLKNAVTKADRQATLEKFFRIVFAQAFSIEHSHDSLLDIDSNQARDIIHTELTAYEFAEALSLRPDALFVKQMFELVDSDGNGYISFREFLNMIIIFAKGSPEDKTKLMFDMYDVDHSGILTRQEFSRMIRSMLELANQALSPEKIDQLITSFFKVAGLQNKQELTLEDFLHLLADHREEMGYMQLSFDVGSGFKAAPSSSARHSAAYRAHETVTRAYSVFQDDKMSSKSSRAKSQIIMETKPEVFEKDLAKQKVYKGIRFIENYKLHIFWMLLYTFVIFGIFIERAYYYSVEREHTGLRQIAGYGVTVTRGAASVMMFTFSTLLLSMCRNIITFLRETFLHKYVPFDAAISFHKYVAIWALIFSVMHIIGHAINFYHISTQPLSDLQCLFPDFHLIPTRMPKFHYWCFATITGMTGVLLVIVLSLIYIFAIQPARRYVFNAFWKTHNLYPILYLLMILHGMGRLVNDPIFYYYFVGPCVLFILDRLISVSRKKVEISVVKAELLPSGVTHLEFKRPADFEYRSGQWVRIACSVLNDNEYHPFTLSSAPHEENLSLHIRAVGPWTSNLRKVYDPNVLQQHAYPKIFLDGPYGEGHQDWFRYEVSVLVGGGIGITPFASILKDVAFKSSVKAKIACKKLYFIWVTRTQKHFEWMTDIIREVEESDKTGLVDVHIFITQFYQKFDLRTTMLYICERHFQRVSGRSLFTGLRSVTHFGRPDFKMFFNSLQQVHPDVNKIAVFSCGPSMMTHGVQCACEELNKHEGAIFIHHFENF